MKKLGDFLMIAIVIGAVLLMMQPKTVNLEPSLISISRPERPRILPIRRPREADTMSYKEAVALVRETGDRVAVIFHPGDKGAIMDWIKDLKGPFVVLDSRELSDRMRRHFRPGKEPHVTMLYRSKDGRVLSYGRIRTGISESNLERFMGQSLKARGPCRT